MKVTEYKHQTASLKHAAKNPVVFDMSDAGTGKGYVRIRDFLRRRKKGGKKMLVIAPRTLLTAVWAEDIKKFAPELKVSVATAENRAKAFEAEADVYVTNTDAVTWLAKQKKGFFADFDTLVFDESSAFKHMSRKRSRAAAKITAHFAYRVCMSATPNSRHLTDLWHQVYLLDGGKRLGNSFYAFRNSTCEPVQRGANRNAIEWLEKDGAREAVYDLIRDITIRHRLDDCADIPPRHDYTLSYVMGAKHLAAYEQMARDAVLLIKEQMKPKRGKPAPDPSIIMAAHAATLENKLLQIASGAVYESPDKYHVIDTGRYEMVMDLVEQRDQVLILYMWKHQRDLLAKEAERRGITHKIITSESSDAVRAATVAQFQAGQFQLVMGHPKSMAHGLTLTRGTSTIWPSPTNDAEMYIQGSSRQRRLGQTKKTEVISILAAGTYDHKAFNQRSGKSNRMQDLMEMFE